MGSKPKRSNPKPSCRFFWRKKTSCSIIFQLLFGAHWIPLVCGRHTQCHSYTCISGWPIPFCLWDVAGPYQSAIHQSMLARWGMVDNGDMLSLCCWRCSSRILDYSFKKLICNLQKRCFLVQGCINHSFVCLTSIWIIPELFHISMATKTPKPKIGLRANFSHKVSSKGIQYKFQPVDWISPGISIGFP